MPTTSLKLSETLKEKIASMAREVAQTPHAYMVQAISEKVARDERRGDFVASAERAEKDFQRSGAAYAHEDVWRYIRARAAGKKGRRPRATKIPKAAR